MYITELSIRRPAFSWVLSLILVVFFQIALKVPESDYKFIDGNSTPHGHNAGDIDVIKVTNVSGAGITTPFYLAEMLEDVR